MWNPLRDPVALAEHQRVPSAGGGASSRSPGLGAVTQASRALILPEEILLLRGGLIGVQSRSGC